MTKVRKCGLRFSDYAESSTIQSIATPWMDAMHTIFSHFHTTSFNTVQASSWPLSVYADRDGDSRSLLLFPPFFCQSQKYVTMSCWAAKTFPFSENEPTATWAAEATQNERRREVTGLMMQGFAAELADLLLFSPRRSFLPSDGRMVHPICFIGDPAK